MDWEYTEFCGCMGSDEFGEVSILKYESKTNHPYCDCSRCGKAIRRKMYVVQGKESGVEHYYLGADCYKRFKENGGRL